MGLIQAVGIVYQAERRKPGMSTRGRAMQLEAQQITKAYGLTEILKGVSLGVDEGEIVALLGPSGCGKSTLLRIIAGLDQDYHGRVIFDGQSLDGVPAHKRDFGLMFQDFALFPHRTAGENIAFGPRMKGLGRPAINRRVEEILELIGLPGYGDRTIFELSGGERQRIALGRALAPRPRLLLLDEPLGALDRTLRERLADDLQAIIKRLGTTSVYVTHDQAEAFAVADRIALMNMGRIIQVDTPRNLYEHPATDFAARFLGLNNLLEGQVIGFEASADGEVVLVETGLGRLRVVTAVAPSNGAQTTMLVRPEAAAAATSGLPNIVSGAIMRRTFRGGSERIIFKHHSGIELELDVDVGLFAGGGEVRLGLRPEALALVQRE